MTEPDSSLERVLAEILVEAEQGQTPQLEHYSQKYPQFASDLAEFFELHLQLSDTGDLAQGQESQQASTGSSLATNPPAYIAKHQILGEIDRGGMGIVYRAKDIQLNRIVALKLIRSGEFASEEEVQRFMSEAEAAAKLSHPGIVPIFEVGTWNGLVYYTMAYIQGKSLAELAADRPLPSTDAVQLVHRLCDAIKYAHEAGVYHRDLKPANVLVSESGQPVIIDFGLAKVANNDQSLTATDQIIGTPAYMTPEHASGQSKANGPGADVYALGAILYFLCTGQPAFSGPTPVDILLQVLDRRPAKPSKLNKEVHRDVDHVCQRALEKKPEERYQSAIELSLDLQRILKGEPLENPREPWTLRLKRWWQREPILAAHTLGIGLATLIVVVAYLLRGQYSEVFYYRLGLMLVWLSTSFFLQSWVDLEKWRTLAILSWLSVDVVIFTSLIAFADTPRSMLLIGYPMMVVASALFYQRRYTYVTLGLCVAAFLLLIWLFPKDDFVKPDFAAIFISGLTVVCLCLAVMIQRVRGLSRFYGE